VALEVEAETPLVLLQLEMLGKVAVAVKQVVFQVHQ
jgi:hypothetical protein